MAIFLLGGLATNQTIRRPRSIVQSVVATGGVYKGQGLIRGDLDESPLRGIPRSRGTLAALGPNGDRVSTITRPSHIRREIALIPSMSRACSPGHLRASQTCYCSFSCGFKPPIPLRRKPPTHLPPTSLHVNTHGPKTGGTTKDPIGFRAKD